LGRKVGKPGYILLGDIPRTFVALKSPVAQQKILVGIEEGPSPGEGRPNLFEKEVKLIKVPPRTPEIFRTGFKSSPTPLSF